MVHEGWIRKPYVQWWLNENPSVKKWLTKVVTKPNTQYDYGYNLMRFCEGVGETPEHLIEIRLSDDRAVLAAFRKKHGIPTQPKRPDKDGSYVILDLLKEFIRSGKLVDLSPHNLGSGDRSREVGEGEAAWDVRCGEGVLQVRGRPRCVAG